MSKYKRRSESYLHPNKPYRWMSAHAPSSFHISRAHLELPQQYIYSRYLLIHQSKVTSNLLLGCAGHGDQVDIMVTTILYYLLILLFLIFPRPSSAEGQMINGQPPSPFPPHLWHEESIIMGPVDCAAGLCRCQLNHRVECSTRDTLNNEIPQLTPPGNKSNDYQIL